MSAPAATEWLCASHTDLTYDPDASDKQRQLDLFVASAATAGPSADPVPGPASFPLLVYLHGGLWVDRDKSAYAALAQHWVRTLGVHVAVVNYRLSSKGGKGVLHPTHTDDVLRAMRWIMAPSTQAKLHFRSDSMILVGHSCGAHMAGLIAIAEAEATLLQELKASTGDLTDASSSSSSPVSALSYLRGCVGLEGIFDSALFARDFPDWSAGVSDAFGSDPSLWESPADYLPAPPAPAAVSSEKDAWVSESRRRIQSKLASVSRRRARVPWLVIHSADDPWVNLPQAERFHAALNAHCTTASSSSSSVPAASSSSAASSSPLPASSLVLVSGTHFEVVERVATAQDEITAPIGRFMQAVMKTTSQS